MQILAKELLRKEHGPHKRWLSYSSFVHHTPHKIKHQEPLASISVMWKGPDNPKQVKSNGNYATEFFF